MKLHFAAQIFALLLPVAALAAPGVTTAAADALLAQGSWEEARRAYLTLHARLEKTAGPEHPQTVLALANACDASVQLATQLDSLRLCTRAVALREKVNGPNSPETARALSDLALLYAADGNLSRAGSLLERALRIATADPHSPDAAGLMNNLGYLYARKGKYGKARDMFERAIGAVENGAGEGGADLVTILNNLGAAELAAHDARSAELHFRRALALNEQSLGGDRARSLKAMNGLTRAEAALGDKR